MKGSRDEQGDKQIIVRGRTPCICERSYTVQQRLTRRTPRPQVIKVGTSSLLRAEQNTLNLSNLARICETVKTLHSQGGHSRAQQAGSDCGPL
jgi:hypothetical protein